MIGRSVFKELDNILARQVREDEGLPDFPEGASELDYCRAIYRDPRQPRRDRLRFLELAAKLATPRLTALHVTTPSDGFAAQLQAAIQRTDEYVASQRRMVGDSRGMVDVTPGCRQVE